jgi:hypothetical protein
MSVKMRAWGGLEVTQAERDNWVEELRKDVDKGTDKSADCRYIMSGNSIVLAIEGASGTEYFDCEVRRVGGWGWR